MSYIPHNPMQPFVSVCTPTFNRRPFIAAMLQCFNHQMYPRDRMEWIIIDDGTDPIEDLVSQHPCVKYHRLDEKISLGKKRNMMHKKARGEIIVYMDDDDYYPPERVSHAVTTLLDHRTRRTGVKLAGSSEMCIYFKTGERSSPHPSSSDNAERSSPSNPVCGQMVQFGPYGPNHATAATFAFWKELLSEMNLKYEEDACLAEERAFLRGYTVPMAQLDPMKVILVFSHEHNTFDKRGLLSNLGNKNSNMQVSAKTVADFIKEPDLLQFYMCDVDAALQSYDAGHPSMKPDVLKQIREKMQKNNQHQKQHQKQQQQDAILKAVITFKASNAEPRNMTVEELIQTVQSQSEKLEKMREMCNKKIRENSELLATIKDRDEVIAAHLETIERQSTLIDHDCKCK
uniref:Glycosyltransferase 2-like domain-containing protein n=1 Tax=viral metagenome TaxID=1070528 RepID=A0A6C0I4S5_9ZZZZ